MRTVFALLVLFLIAYLIEVGGLEPDPISPLIFGLGSVLCVWQDIKEIYDKKDNK